MVLIIDPNPQSAANIAAIVQRIDARLVFQTSTDCQEGWVLTRGCRPWMIICNAEEPYAVMYFDRVREILPKAYLVLTGHPPSDEAFNRANGVVPRVTYETLLPHVRSAKESRQKDSRRASGVITGDKAAPKEPKHINITVATDGLKFVVPAAGNATAEDFLVQLGKRKVKSILLTRGQQQQTAELSTKLQDGDQLRLEFD